MERQSDSMPLVHRGDYVRYNICLTFCQDNSQYVDMYNVLKMYFLNLTPLTIYKMLHILEPFSFCSTFFHSVFSSACYLFVITVP